VFGKRVLRGTFKPKVEGEKGVGENCIIRSFITFTVRKI
jgi:hypothetical protein